MNCLISEYNSQFIRKCVSSSTEKELQKKKIQKKYTNVHLLESLVLNNDRFPELTVNYKNAI